MTKSMELTKRAIQKHLEDPFKEEIINSSVSEGDLLKADYKEGDVCWPHNIS